MHPSHRISAALILATLSAGAGDTLEKIAHRTHPDDTKTTLQQIIQLNNLKSPNAIREGQTLQLP